MARHSKQAILESASGTHLRYIAATEGYELVEEGYAYRVHGDGGQATFRLQNNEMTNATPGRSQSTLTRSDMHRNAAASVGHRRNRSRIKVDAWPKVHDTFSVTVVAGLAFTPDPREAAKRVKQMRKRAKACAN